MSELGTGLFVPVDKAIETQLRYNVVGQYAQNSLWFKCSGTPTQQNLEDACDLAEVAWVEWRNQLSTALTLYELRSYDRTTQVAPSFVRAPAGPDTGVITGDVSPNNVAACISLRTGYGHRSARGRVYIPGIPDGNLIASTLDTDLRDALAQGIQYILSEQAALGLTLCVASRYHLGLPRPLGVMTPITGAFVDQYADSQRRRLPGRGR